MKISVFGLGYVGCVTAACLAHSGHKVTGVDINVNKVEMIRDGLSPISEPGLEKLIQETRQSGRLSASSDGCQAVLDSDISLVCVGTPSRSNGALNTQYVERICSQIGDALAAKKQYHLVVIRSTILPGTMKRKLIPILKHQSQLHVGEDFGVCMNPEFLREGSALKDYHNPGFIVIGQSDPRSGDLLEEMYQHIEAPVYRCSLEVAEMVKYACNSFHAIKIAFANEIGSICKTQGIDSREVMNLLCQDHRLNISPAYLKPGFAFGGSCLPKDVRALVYQAKEKDLEIPVISSLLPSNHKHIERSIEMVKKTNKHKVGVLGLSFKAWTDDIRESPTVYLVETLLGQGYQLSIYDENVDPEKLVGANKAFLERELPHIASIMKKSLKEVVDEAEVIVLANGSPSFDQVPPLLNKDQILIDLVGINEKGRKHMKGKYEGIAW